MTHTMRTTIGRGVVGLLAFSAIAILAVLVVVPRLFGGAALTVLSGSMTPTFPVGSVVVVRPVEPPDVQEGDVITYAEPGGSFTTHRVVDVTTDSGEPSFTTKGDANRGEDAEPVTAEALRGRVWFSVPYLGRVRDVVSSPSGIVAILTLVVLALAWERLRSITQHLPRLRGPAVIPSAHRRQTAEAGDSPTTSMAMAASPALPGSAASAAVLALASTSVTVPTVGPPGSHLHAPADMSARQQLLVLRLGIGWLERREVIDLLPLIRGHVTAIGPDSLDLAVVGTPAHLDSVEEMLEQYSVTHCGRSSVVTLLARSPISAPAPFTVAPHHVQEAH